MILIALSLFYTTHELQNLSTFESETLSPEETYIGGIFYRSETDWTVWIGGKKIGPADATQYAIHSVSQQQVCFKKELIECLTPGSKVPTWVR